MYLTWAIAVFLAFFPFSRINNFWRLNVVAGSIPTRASIKSPIKMRLLKGCAKIVPALSLRELQKLTPSKETARYSRSAANVSRKRCGYPSAILAALNTSAIRLRQTDAAACTFESPDQK